MPGNLPYRIAKKADAERIAFLLNQRHKDRLHLLTKPKNRRDSHWRIEIVNPETGEFIGWVSV